MATASPSRSTGPCSSSRWASAPPSGRICPTGKASCWNAFSTPCARPSARTCAVWRSREKGGSGPLFLSSRFRCAEFFLNKTKLFRSFTALKRHNHKNYVNFSDAQAVPKRRTKTTTDKPFPRMRRVGIRGSVREGYRVTIPTAGTAKVSAFVRGTPGASARGRRPGRRSHAFVTGISA